MSSQSSTSSLESLNESSTTKYGQKIKKPANTIGRIFYRMNLHQFCLSHTVVTAANDGGYREN